MVPSTEWNQTLERTRNKLASWRQRNKPPKPIPDPTNDLTFPPPGAI